MTESINFQNAELRALKVQQLHRKKAIAVGLLVFAAILFVIGTYLHARSAHWGIGLMIAMSEAAMVGGLADWFAVTALFRHPLNQKWIPHTAIIPSKKDAIGTNLANFICDHFLGSEQVIAKMREIKPADRLTGYLNDHDATERLGDLAPRVVPHLVRVLDSPQLHQFIQRTVIDRVGKLDVASIIARSLEMMTHDRRHEGILTSVLVYLHERLESPDLRAEIAARVEASMWKVLKWAQVDDIVADKVTDKIINSLRQLLAEMIDDPEHEMRHRIDDEMRKLVDRLRDDEVTRERVHHFRDSLMQNPEISRYVTGLWQEFLAWLLRDSESDQSVVREHVISTARALGRNLTEDAGMRDWIDLQLENAVEPLLDRYRDSIRNFIVERVQKWPADELTNELELSIGTDLQYVRYNGTVVGALIGGLLFGTKMLIDHLA